MMKTKCWAAATLAAGQLLLPAQAHHSFAMFDQTREVTLKCGEFGAWCWHRREIAACIERLERLGQRESVAGLAREPEQRVLAILETSRCRRDRELGQLPSRRGNTGCLREALPFGRVPIEDACEYLGSGRRRVHRRAQIGRGWMKRCDTTCWDLVPSPDAPRVSPDL